MEQPTSQGTAGTVLSHQVIPLPARYVPYVPVPAPNRSGSLKLTPPRERIRRHAVRQVAILEVAGRLSDVVQDLEHAIQLALANEPRGVVCDLSGMLDAGEPAAIEVLATAGRHVRDWPGVPVAVACPNPRMRQVLLAHPLGGHLIVTESLFSAVTAVLATPYLMVQCVRLIPHPSAPRASRDFVSRTLADWQLDDVIPLASLVAGELVASSTIHAGTSIDLSMVWDRAALRLGVRDHGPALAAQPRPADVRQRGLLLVARVSRSWGALPTEDGGEAVWAVMDAPRPVTLDAPRAVTGNWLRPPGAQAQPKPGRSAAVVTTI